MAAKGDRSKTGVLDGVVVGLNGSSLLRDGENGVITWMEWTADYQRINIVLCSRDT